MTKLCTTTLIKNYKHTPEYHKYFIASSVYCVTNIYTYTETYNTQAIMKQKYLTWL